jgi:glycosyltransferase involved in cell wall biosynthesis
MSMPARRLVVFSEAVGRGGAEIALRNLIAELDSSYELTVMGVDTAICSWLAAARPGTRTTLVRPVRHRLSVGAFLALRRAIAASRPDIFHANLRTIADGQYALAAALTIRGLAVVAVEQLPIAPHGRLSIWLKRRTSARLAAHVCVGERAARQVEDIVGLPRGSIRTIHNGVPDLGASEPPPDGPRTVVGTLARFDRIKGIDLLLEAAVGLPTTSLLLIGDGPERERIAAQAARLGIDDRVEITRWTDHARDRLREIDIFVLPSRNEGFPLSIVEAMFAARPVVATDVGSVREAVDEGRTGFVVPPDDVSALRDALDQLVCNRELRRRMGDAGRQRALQGFTSAVMARGFEQLYEEIDGRASATRKQPSRAGEKAC